MILDFLRRETRQNHQTVEAVFYGEKIMDGSLTLSQYQDMIQKNQYIFQSLEREISEKYKLFFNNLNYHPNLSRHELLNRDLSQLSALPIDYAINLPDYDSAEALVGGLYVLEGSMLGGKMIGNKIKENENLVAVDNFHFYDVKKKIGSDWKKFRNFAEDFIRDNSVFKEALRGANDTFKTFEAVYRIK